MSKFILGLVLVTGIQASASTFQIKSVECVVQHDVDIPNTYDSFPLVQNGLGVYSANLPDGVVATLKSEDSGFNVFYHTVSVQLGKLTVSNIGSTTKNIGPNDPIVATFVRTEGQIDGRQFYCDAEVDPIR